MSLTNYDDEDSDDEKKGRAAEQYSADGDSYEPVGECVKHLPAGFYRIKVTYRGPIFEKFTITSDMLIELPTSQAAAVFHDIKTFLDARALYEKLGLAHKRGYMFHGPPGTGKTSTAILVAKHIVDAGGIVFIPSSIQGFFMAADAMLKMEQDRPKMFLLEELDSIKGHDDEEEQARLLSILDGELSLANSVFVATTNDFASLSDRFVSRPGRFDQVVEITHIDRGVQHQYAMEVLGRLHGTDVAKKKADALIEHVKGMSLAYIRELIVATEILGEAVNPAVLRLRSMMKAEKKTASA